MSDKKLSFHIGEKNTVALSTGFGDVKSNLEIGILSLNKQTVSILSGDGIDGAGLTFVSAHHAFNQNGPSCVGGNCAVASITARPGGWGKDTFTNYLPGHCAWG